jgi:hypothetical protein
MVGISQGASKKKVGLTTYGLLRPSESDKRPTIGWKLAEVKRNAVESHDALLELWK